MRLDIEERRRDRIRKDTDLYHGCGMLIGGLIFGVLGLIVGITLAAIGVGSLGLLTGWASVGAGFGIYVLIATAGCFIGGFCGHIVCKCCSNQAARIDALLRESTMYINAQDYYRPYQTPGVSSVPVRPSPSLRAGPASELSLDNAVPAANAEIDHLPLLATALR